VRVLYPALPTRSGQHPDDALGSRRVGEPLISGQELAAKNLGERHIGGVVRDHVGPELIDASHQREGRIAVQIDGGEVVDRRREPPVGDRARELALAQHSDGFDVDEIRGGDIAGNSDLPRARRPSGPDDLRGLRFLADRLGHHFVRGIVLYTRPTSVQLGDEPRMRAMPLDSLWAIDDSLLEQA